jgi:hypothetical protein
MVDPVVLAVVSSAVTQLALKVIEGSSSEAGKDLWKAVKKRLGWATNPPVDSLSIEIANRLKDDEKLTNEVTDLLKGKPSEVGAASALVARIEASKVVVAHTMTVEGDFRM